MSDFDKLRSELKEQGFAFEKTTKGHWKVSSPPGRPPPATVTFSESQDPRAIKNTISDLRKIGFEWPPPPSRRNGSYPSERYEFSACPSCHQQTFNVNAGTCENIGGCPTHAPVDTDSLYLEVKAARELVTMADVELSAKKFDVEKATSALHVATEKYKQLKDTHERLKQQLIKALEE